MTTDRTRLVGTLREEEFQTVAQLSAALKIDEATVAGHLQQLEQDGLPLERAGDRGFRLREEITPIDAENLVEELEKASIESISEYFNPPKSLSFIKSLIKSIDSISKFL